MKIAPISEALRARLDKDNDIKRRYIDASKRTVPRFSPLVQPDAEWNTGVYDNALGVTLEDGGAKFTIFNWGKPLAGSFVSRADLRRLRERLNTLDLD